MRSILVTILILFLLVLLIRAATQESRSVSVFVGPQVKGQIKEYRPRTLSRLTPGLVQRLLGESNFQSVHSASVYLYLDPSNRQRYFPDQSPELAIASLASFSDLCDLDLRFDGSSSAQAISLEPLRHCRRLERLELRAPSKEVVLSACKFARAKNFSLYQCRLDDEMIEALVKATQVETIQFNSCAVSANQLRSLKQMKKLRWIHFFQCDPNPNRDGSFDFRIEQMTGGITLVDEQSRQTKVDAQSWLEKELNGIQITGL